MSATNGPSRQGKGTLEPSTADSRWPEVLLQQDVHAAEHLGQQEVFSSTVENVVRRFVPPRWPGETEPLGRGAGGRGVCAVGENPGDGGCGHRLPP